MSWYVASLPLHLGGLGLRSSCRLAGAIHWAAWADIFAVLSQRFPTLATKIQQALEEGSAAPSLQVVRQQTDGLRALGFECPSWTALRNGVRPALPEEDEEDPTHFKHGWQFYATKHTLLNEHSSLLHQLAPDQQALLRSQSGAGAGTWLLAVLPCEWMTLPDNLFLLALRRRLFLPVPLAAAKCKFYGNGADRWGHHALACTRSGWLKRRATGLEKAWVQVLSEAGAAAHHRPLLRDLAIPGVSDTDSRQLDILAGGLSLFGGRTIVGDATLRSPLSGAGIPHGAAATVDGATFPPARRDKANTYPELVAPSARLMRNCLMRNTTICTYEAA